MKKRIYRRISVNEFQLKSIPLHDVGGRLVVGIDVAKVDMVAALTALDGRVLATLGWKSPDENGRFLELLRAVRSAGVVVDVAMEPSGTYGDILRHQLVGAGFAVFRVSGKRTHDAREVYDGVPSIHDAKAAAIVAKLHRDGLSATWPLDSEEKRQLRAAITIMDLHQRRYLQLVHQVESWLARHWPELPSLIELTSASLLALLARIGGPVDVARDPEAARNLLHGISHGLLQPDKIAAVLESARRTAGIALLPLERDALMAIAAEAHRALRAFKEAKLKVEQLSEHTPARQLAPVVGKATAAVIFVEVGSPTAFPSVRAFVKAIGLNLKEKSSGRYQGQLKLTKRGSSRARQFLWLAVFRWIQSDPIARAWYMKKKQRDGGKSSRAAVALMRKLAAALFHVGRGDTFDSAKLFDLERLQLTSR